MLISLYKLGVVAACTEFESSASSAFFYCAILVFLQGVNETVSLLECYAA